MDTVRIIEIKKNVFQANEINADKLRAKLKREGTYLINLMSSPGSGKTTTLTRLINILKKDFKIAVMEADIDSDVDAISIAKNTGVDAIQLHTGGMCHLDAGMTAEGLLGFEGKGYDLIFLENVGNLVCPAEFDTGATRNMMILSVPEGHDKPLKYPLMFQITDIALINKIDVMPYFDFDLDLCKSYIARRNPKTKVFPISAKQGDGVDELADYLRSEIMEYKKGE